MHVLAYCRLLETRFSEARTLLESALAIEPQAPEIHHNLGVLLAHTVGGDTGRSHIREAVRLNPQDAIFVASASARRAQNLEGLVRGAQLKLFWRYANAYIRFSMAAVLIVVSVWWPPAWPVLAWSGAMVLRARYERRLFEPRKSLAVSGLALSAALLLAAAVSSLPGSLAYLLPGIGAWSLQNAAITWPTQLGRSLLVLLFAASLAASGVVTISLGPEALVTSQLAIGYLYFVTAGLLMRLAKR
jgi:hypothetical protein